MLHFRNFAFSSTNSDKSFLKDRSSIHPRPIAMVRLVGFSNPPRAVSRFTILFQKPENSVHAEPLEREVLSLK